MGSVAVATKSFPIQMLLGHCDNLVCNLCVKHLNRLGFESYLFQRNWHSLSLVSLLATTQNSWFRNLFSKRHSNFKIPQTIKWKNASILDATNQELVNVARYVKHVDFQYLFVFLFLSFAPSLGYFVFEKLTASPNDPHPLPNAVQIKSRTKLRFIKKC